MHKDMWAYIFEGSIKYTTLEEPRCCRVAPASHPSTSLIFTDKHVTLERSLENKLVDGRLAQLTKASPDIYTKPV